MEIIEGKTFDKERSLYNLCDARVVNCTFAGPEDGESMLKEAHGISVENCRFSLRYPFWHDTDFSVKACTLDAAARAPLWYCENGRIEDTRFDCVKCLRECRNMRFSDTEAASTEFGWRCDGLFFENCKISGEYPLFESKNIKAENISLKGKYSFQYIENAVIENSVLDTKDAFWHAKNVTVKNCDVIGEYLGWYSDGLTLINCRISGTQPLCYCKNLTLSGCTMKGCDLAFEYSDVTADIVGTVDSVKNPKSGRIVADGFGDIILEHSVVKTACEINKR